MENLEKTKPNYPGDFHGQVHEVETEKGHRIVKFPIKKPDGSKDFGMKKIPNKVKIVHVWDNNKKEWEKRHDKAHLPGTQISNVSYDTPMQAAKRKMEAHEASKKASTENKKTKIITKSN